MNRWLDFSGAPPLLIPKRLAVEWHGALNTDSGNYSDLNTNDPRTDYDRACKEAWPGRGVLALGQASALVLYTEFDDHTWDEQLSLVACGGWLPTEEQLGQANWTDALFWKVADPEILLMNSAASGSVDVREDDSLEFRLKPGTYIVEYAEIEGERYFGCFHRFTRTG